MSEIRRKRTARQAEPQLQVPGRSMNPALDAEAGRLNQMAAQAAMQPQIPAERAVLTAEEEEAYNLGANDFLSKPILLSKLTHSIATQLNIPLDI